MEFLKKLTSFAQFSALLGTLKVLGIGSHIEYSGERYLFTDSFIEYCLELTTIDSAS